MSLQALHVFDYLIDKNIFALQVPQPLSYAVILYLAGLSLRDLSERYSLIGAFRDWVHRTSVLFNPSRKFRRIVAVDETVIGLNGHKCFVWSAIDVDSGEMVLQQRER